MTNARSAAATGLPVFDQSTLPDIYAMDVHGSCMAPDYPHGCYAKVSKTESYGVGDVVVVWFRPELVKPGNAPAILKRIALMPPPWVQFPFKESPKSEVHALLMLSANDQPDSWLRFRCSDIAAIHKVTGTLDPEEVNFEPTQRSKRRAPRQEMRA